MLLHITYVEIPNPCDDGISCDLWEHNRMIEVRYQGDEIYEPGNEPF